MADREPTEQDVEAYQKYLLSNGAKEKDVEDYGNYLKANIYKYSESGSRVRGLLHTGSLGYDEDIGGATNVVTSPLKILQSDDKLQKIKDLFDSGKKDYAAKNAASEKQNPLSYMAGEGVGGIGALYGALRTLGLTQPTKTVIPEQVIPGKIIPETVGPSVPSSIDMPTGTGKFLLPGEVTPGSIVPGRTIPGQTIEGPSKAMQAITKLKDSGALEKLGKLGLAIEAIRRLGRH